MTTPLTTERLREIAARSALPERQAMAAELLAKREECEALQRERDESRDLIASAMHDVGERSFLEDAQRILQGCVAPYSCEQMKSVADALRQWRDKWAILLETLVRSNEERDAAREACERKHQDGWAWQQLSQQREAERDAYKATLDDVCKALGADVDSAVPQALMFKEKAAEAEKLRIAYRISSDTANKKMADVVILEARLDLLEIELDAVKRQRDEAVAAADGFAAAQQPKPEVQP